MFQVLIFIMALVSVIPGSYTYASDSSNQLGTIEFPTSTSSKPAQKHFIRGVAALHSFWYTEALNAFEKNGLIHKVPDMANLIRYALCQSECSFEKHLHNHAHLLCSNCNETYCVNDFKIPVVNECKGFIIDNLKIILEGSCVDCQQSYK